MTTTHQRIRGGRMSLQDDIARYLYVRDEATNAPENIAAGLERDYYLVKLADLPEVETSGGESFHWSDAGSAISTKATTESAWAKARGAIALALHLQARESEAAVLARRRDELAARLEVSANGGYDRLCDGERGVIDDLIAAEAEVARLKGEKA